MSSHDVPDRVPPVQAALRTGAPTELHAPGRADAGVTVRAIACDVAMRWLWDYVDARLPGAPRVALEVHLATCAACPAHVAFARAMRHALADAPAPGPADARASDDAGQTPLRARVQRALANARIQVTPHAGTIRE